MELSSKHCVPCAEGEAPMTTERAREMAREVPDWSLADREPKLEREFSFPDFAQSIKFVNQVARIAEKEGHHPDIHVHYDRVKLVLWTHSIGGLSENDFILAAKINTLRSSRAA